MRYLCFFLSLSFLFSLTGAEPNLPKVLVHPEMTTDIVMDSIKNAKHSISFSALSIPTKEFAEEIVAAHKRGIDVYLIITNPFFEVGTDYSTMSKKFETDVQTLKNMKDRLQRDISYLNILTDNNIYPHYIDRKYYINHQKLLIIDDCAFIASSPRCEKRDFCVTITDKKHIEALQDFFFRDYYQLDNDGSALEELGYVIGPENQRVKLEELTSSAKKSVHFYAADFNDKVICSIVEQLLLQRVKVYVLFTPHFFGFNEQSLNTDYYLKRIKQLGAKVRAVREPFIHSKVIMVDIDDDENKKMYFGSCNLFSNSIDHTRELGFIFTCDEYIAPIYSAFLKDWDRGADY